MLRRAFSLLLGLACSLAVHSLRAQAPVYPTPPAAVLDTPSDPGPTLSSPDSVVPSRGPRLLDIRPVSAPATDDLKVVPTLKPPAVPPMTIPAPFVPAVATSDAIQRVDDRSQEPAFLPPAEARPLPPAPLQSFPLAQAQPLPPPGVPQPALLPLQPQQDQFAVGSDLSMKATWRNGLVLETPNKDFYIHLGGMVHYDLGLYNAGDGVQFGPGGVGEMSDGVVLRRGRLGAEGNFWEVFGFKTEFDFAGSTTADGRVINTPVPTEVYLSVTNLPFIGNVRVGNQKEPLSLEHLTNERFLEFLERSASFDAFFPAEYVPGITVFDTALDERMTWAAGLYKTTRDPFGFGVGDGQYSVTGRLTGLPIDRDEGATLVHVGVGASHRDLTDGTARFRVRDAVRGAPEPLLNVLADTGVFPGQSQSLMVLESAVVLGQFSVQGEYTVSRVNDAALPGGGAGDLLFQGGYVEVLYFLTGENRRYNRRRGAFDRVIPYENFFLVRGEDGQQHYGMGAWELAARYSAVDLTDRGIQGGVLHDLTLGVNWYLTPNAKVQWNYDVVRRSATGGADGTIHGLGVRMALDF